MNRFDRSSSSSTLSLSFVLSALALAAPACSSSDATPPQDLGDSSVAADGDTGGSVDTAPGNDAVLDVKDDTGDGGDAGDGGCGGTTFTATARDVNILVVLDKSGSMSQKPTGFSTTKWDAVKTALGTALDKSKNRLNLGLEMFPFNPTTPIDNPCSGNCCDMSAGDAAINVPIGAGTTTLAAITAAIGATSPGGATPTAVALLRAADYFTTGAGKSLKGDRYVLLATDGGPNCNKALTCDAAHCTTNLDGSCSTTTPNCCLGKNLDCLDDASTTDALTALNKAGIKTFVVGIPGTEAYSSFLDAFATAGGEVSPTPPPKYFAVSASKDVAGLTAAFDLITGSLITTCRFQLTSTPTDPDKVNVFIDGKLVPQGGADGWSYDTTTDPPTIVLKGTTCTGVETKGAKSIDVPYGCATIR